MFTLLSERVRSIENDFNQRNLSNVSEFIRNLQENEKRKLQIVVQLQILKRDQLSRGDEFGTDQEFVINHQKLCVEFQQIILSIFENLVDLRETIYEEAENEGFVME